MQLTPDTTVVFEIAGLPINATIFNTWIVMVVLTLASWIATRKLRPDVPPGRLRNALEVIVLLIEDQVKSITSVGVQRILYFAGTLFLFIAASNILAVIPGFRSPAGSLSTTAALTIAVLFAVPLFGIFHGGPRQYLAKFIEPSIVILPFNLIGEVSKAVSLSIRLYGNVMSGAMIVAILLGVTPFFFPIIMDLFGLLIGVIQAYVFSVLATVYIAAAMAEPELNTSSEDSL